jgi:hypothetical protein
MLKPNSSFTFTKINDVLVSTDLVEQFQNPSKFIAGRLIVSCILGLILAWMGTFVFKGSPVLYPGIFLVSIILGLFLTRKEPWIEISRIDGSITIYNNSTKKKIVTKYENGSYEFSLMDLTPITMSRDWGYVVKSEKTKYCNRVYKLFSFGVEGYSFEREKYAIEMTMAIFNFLSDLPYDKQMILDCPEDLAEKFRVIS